MIKEQCPICYSELKIIDCTPCYDCGHLPIEINHFKDGKHKYNIYNVYNGLELQLCNFCDVDYGSYKSEYFGFNNNQRIGFENFELIKSIESPRLEKDKYCSKCKKRLRFLTFLNDMREMNMKYSIPDKRELSKTEIEFLTYLFEKEKPEWLNLVEKLKVIARCGCGKCPTIMFGELFDSEIQTNKSVVIDYMGKGINGELIGVTLLGTEQLPTDLEFWPIDGKSEITDLPKIDTLKLLE